MAAGWPDVAGAVPSADEGVVAGGAAFAGTTVVDVGDGTGFVSAAGDPTVADDPHDATARAVTITRPRRTRSIVGEDSFTSSNASGDCRWVCGRRLRSLSA